MGRDSINALVAKGLVVAGTMTGSIIVARCLGPNGAGALAVLIVFLQSLQQVGGLGLPTANVYFLSTGKRDPCVVVNAIVFPVLTGIVLAAGLALFRDDVAATLLGGADPWLLLTILSLLPFRIVQDSLYSLLRAEKRFAAWNRLQVVAPLVDLAGIVVALIVLDGDLVTAVAARAVTGILSVIPLLFALREELALRVGLHWKQLRRSLAFGMQTFVHIVTTQLHYRIDVFLIALLLGNVSVAHYSVAVSLISLLWILPDSIGLVVLPRLVKLDEKNAHELIAYLSRTTVAITAIGCLVAIVTAPFLVPLFYGSEFAKAATVVPTLAVGILAMGVGRILIRDFTSRARQGVNVAAGAVALAINVVLNLVLIPDWGIQGAAVATAISYSVSTGVLLVTFRRVSGLSLVHTLVPRRADIATFFSELRRKRRP